MKKRPLIYLGLALLFAIAIAIIENPFEPRTSDESLEYFIKGYDSDQVVRLVVNQLLDKAILKKEGGGWFVAEGVSNPKEELLKKEDREIPEEVSKPADSSRVVSALGYFGGLYSGILVSKNPDSRSNYRVGVDGLHIAAYDSADKTIFDVVVGKGGPDFTSTYIRRSDEDEVYLVKRSFAGAFSPRASDWEKKEPEKEAEPKVE